MRPGEEAHHGMCRNFFSGARARSDSPVPCQLLTVVLPVRRNLGRIGLSLLGCCGVAEGGSRAMSEQQGDATNAWGAAQAPQPPTPPPPRDPEHDQASASERAFAEGWPAQPGWVPEGGVGTN